MRSSPLLELDTAVKEKCHMCVLLVSVGVELDLVADTTLRESVQRLLVEDFTLGIDASYSAMHTAIDSIDFLSLQPSKIRIHDSTSYLACTVRSVVDDNESPSLIGVVIYALLGVRIVRLISCHDIPESLQQELP